MALPSDYISGTITLTNGSTAFTGTGTGWLAADFREGDIILDVEGGEGAVAVIASITSNTAGVLSKEWEGPTLTGVTYRMRYQWDSGRVSAQSRAAIEMLGNGNLQSFASLTGPGVPVFDGPHSVTIKPESDFVNGVAYDVQVDTLAGRDAYDGQSEGFAVLVSDVGDGRSALYSKESNTVGDWGAPAYITGPVGPLPEVEATVTSLPPGSTATVTPTPIAGGVRLDFDLPGASGFYNAGVYDIAETYNTDDVTRHNGSSFIALQAVPAGESPSNAFPPVDTAYWQVLAAKGADGTGTGDVVGPSGAVADRIAVFDGTTGKLIKDGGVSIDDLNGGVFSSIQVAESFSPNTAPPLLQVNGRENAGDLGVFSDRAVAFQKEASEPAAAPKFSITLASSAVAWYGFRGKQIVPELFGPASDAAGPIQDCIDYLSDGNGLTGNNGGVIQLGEDTYDIGNTTILYKSNIKLRGLGQSTNADGLLTRIRYTGTDVAFKPTDPTKQLEHVEVSDLMIFAPNTAVGIFEAQSTKWFHFNRNWLYGGEAGPKGLIVRPYFTKKTITGITKASPGVVTATAHGFADGTPIVIQGVSGMTQVNARVFIVKNPTANTFELYAGSSPVNTSGFGTYTSGGQAIRFDTDPTYARIHDNYMGGVSWGIDMRDANAAIVSGNRIQPNANGKGVYFGTEGPIPHSMNQSTIQANSVEANGTGIVAYQFGPTTYGFDVIGNRVELPGTGTIGFYAESGAEQLHLSGNYTSGVATPMLDPGFAFYGNDPVFRNVKAQIVGATGVLAAGSRNVASSTRTSTGMYSLVFSQPLVDIGRYSVSLAVGGSISSAFYTGFTASGITINVATLGTGAYADPSVVALEISAK